MHTGSETQINKLTSNCDYYSEHNEPKSDCAHKSTSVSNFVFMTKLSSSPCNNGYHRGCRYKVGVFCTRFLNIFYSITGKVICWAKSSLVYLVSIFLPWWTAFDVLRYGEKSIAGAPKSKKAPVEQSSTTSSSYITHHTVQESLLRRRNKCCQHHRASPYNDGPINFAYFSALKKMPVSPSTSKNASYLSPRLRQNYNCDYNSQNYANYCSLPRNLKQTGHHVDCVSQNYNFIKQHTYDRNQPQVRQQQPSGYWRSMKKCSVDSKLKNCVLNSPVVYRAQSKENFVVGSHHEPDYRRTSRSRQQNGDELYEMSSDLQQKQLEILCKRYGGYCRARRAAIVVQRAYRKHAMEKNFERVRKRRSGLPQQLAPSSSNAYNNEKSSNFVSKVCVNQDDDEPANHLDTFYAPETPRCGKLDERLPAVVYPGCCSKDECRLFYANDDHKYSTPEGNIQLFRRPSNETIDKSYVSYVKIGAYTDNYVNYRSVNIVNNDRAVKECSTLKNCSSSGVDEKICFANKFNANGNNYSSFSGPRHFTRHDFKLPKHLAGNPTTNWDCCRVDEPLDTSQGMHTYSNSLDGTARGSPAVRGPTVIAVDKTCVLYRKPLSRPADEDMFENTALNNEEKDGILSRDLDGGSEDGNGTATRYYRLPPSTSREDLLRRRQYRIALNFFNKKPERGVEFLVCWGFVDRTPRAVAYFLAHRKGLSRQMIGEYLGNLQNPFNQRVLNCFADQFDMHNMQIDVALRKFQSLFRLPGEAQKIERIVEVFAKRYCQCNTEIISRFNQTDTVFIVAFAIIMLNTDLHSPNVKANKRMKMEDFIKNLRGIDAGSNVDPKLLTDMYSRVKQLEFRADPDHVTQVLKVESSLVGKKPNLALPHRRLVCYCRLNEIPDPSKKQSSNVHQREVFLFNDMLMMTKVLSSRKKSGITYSFRESHCLVGAQVHTFKNQHYANGIEVNFVLENMKLYFNTRTDEDRMKFVEDLKEAAQETDEMEALRIELELQKQSGNRCSVRYLLGQDLNNHVTAQDSLPSDQPRRDSDRVSGLYDPDPSNIHRHSSATSLDSGMSSASLCSRESFQHAQNNTLTMIHENAVPNE